MHKFVISQFGTKEKRFFIENKRDWLYSRGGRSLADLVSDSKGDFVWMSNGDGTDTKVYLPKLPK